MGATDESAAILAQQLAARFLSAGSYVFGTRMAAGDLRHVMPAAAAVGAVARYFEEGYGFAALHVQGVGYEHGAPNPKVHVYVTTGPREKEIGGDGDVRESRLIVLARSLYGQRPRTVRPIRARSISESTELHVAVPVLPPVSRTLGHWAR